MITRTELAGLLLGIWASALFLCALVVLIGVAS